MQYSEYYATDFLSCSTNAEYFEIVPYHALLTLHLVIPNLIVLAGPSDLNLLSHRFVTTHVHIFVVKNHPTSSLFNQ